MDEYLPPVVTRLKADLSDLVFGLVQARALVSAWAQGVREDIDAVLRDAGRRAGLGFGEELRTSVQQDLGGFDQEVERSFAPQVARSMAAAGASAGSKFGSSFSGLATPLIVLGIIAVAPLLSAAVAAAITLGIGLGFAGLAAFMLREEPALVAAATRFKDSITAVFKDAAAPMLGPLVQFMDILTSGIKALGPDFKAIFATIAPSIPGLATGLIGFLREMMPGLKELAPIMGQLISALGAALPEMGKGLGELFKSLAESGPGMIKFLQDLGPMIGSGLKVLGEFLRTLIEVYLFVSNLRDKATAGGWDTPWEAWATGARIAWEWIKKVGAAGGEWISGAVDGVKHWAIDTWARVEKWWADFSTAVSTKGKMVLDWFEALPGRVADFLASLPGKMTDVAVAAFDAFFEASGFLVVRLIQLWDQLPEMITNVALRIWNILKNWAAEVRAFVADAFRAMIDMVVERWNFLINELPGILGRIITNIIDWAVNMRNTVIGKAAEMVNGFMNWWGGLPDRVIGAANTTRNRLMDWARGARDWLWQTGRDIISGLIDGITSMINAAINAVKRAIDRIRDGARDVLGIRSPSRVFAQLGRYTVDGYIAGLRSGDGALSRAWSALSAPEGLVTPAMAMAGGAGAAGITTAATGGTGPADSRPLLVQLVMDGGVLVEKLIEPAQRRKNRTGETGLA